MLPLKSLAIKKALENNWEDAYRLNKQLVDENPQDIDSLNRLAFSLLKLGKYAKAQEVYKKVIRIDKTNPIAMKNLKKADSLTKTPFKKLENRQNYYANIQEMFIEESGKTKTVELKNVTDKKTLSLLEPGDEVFLVVKRSKMFVQLESKKYVGMLPDNVGLRLVRLIKGGNKYQSFIKSIDEKNVSIFIKELKKSGKFRNQPSFSTSQFSYQSSDDSYSEENKEEEKNEE